MGSVGLQETHMDALKPFNSKYIALTMRGGFFTKFKALAHGVPWHGIARFFRSVNPISTIGDILCPHITTGTTEFSDLPTGL